MLLSAVSVWVVAQSSSEIPEGLMNNPVLKNEKGDLVTDCHSIMGRWRKNFSQLFNVHRVSDVRQREINTTEPLLPEPSAFEVEMAIDKLKR